MSKYTAALAAFVLALVLVTAALALHSEDQQEADPEPTFAIEYRNLDGADNSCNPDSYSPGDLVKLRTVSKEDTFFGGWYTDPECRDLCMEITPGMFGNIVLYAKWQDNMVGRQLTFDISGTVEEGLYGKYDVTGERVLTYRSHDDVDGYFINYHNRTYYDYGEMSYDDETDFCEWDPAQFFDVSVIGFETVDSVYGPKLCEIQEHRENDYRIRFWVGEHDRVVYRGEEVIHEEGKDTVFTYTLRENTVAVMAEVYRLTAYADRGISTTGSGTYGPGESVTLKAEVHEGTDFIGWYDWDLNLVSLNTEVTLTTGWEDSCYFALNSYDPDFEGTTFTDSRFDLETGYEDVRWNICPYGLHDVEWRGTGDLVECHFIEPGWYEIYAWNKEAGYYGYRTAYLDGDAVRDFDWQYGGNNYSYRLVIEYQDILDYYTLADWTCRHCRIGPDNPDHAHEKSFVTWEDPYIRQIAEDLKKMAAGMSDAETCRFVLSFLDDMAYQSDNLFFGYSDYWKFPLETLFDKAGDCEDTSLLYLSIMKAMGYETALVLFPNHAMSAVKLQGDYGDYDYFRDSAGNRYYYVESTAGSLKFGFISEVVDVRDEIQVFL